MDFPGRVQSSSKNQRKELLQNARIARAERESKKRAARATVTLQSFGHRAVALLRGYRTRIMKLQAGLNQLLALQTSSASDVAQVIDEYLYLARRSHKTIVQRVLLTSKCSLDKVQAAIYRSLINSCRDKNVDANYLSLLCTNDRIQVQFMHLVEDISISLTSDVNYESAVIALFLLFQNPSRWAVPAVVPAAVLITGIQNAIINGMGIHRFYDAIATRLFHLTDVDAPHTKKTQTTLALLVATAVQPLAVVDGMSSEIQWLHHGFALSVLAIPFLQTRFRLANAPDSLLKLMTSDAILARSMSSLTMPVPSTDADDDVVMDGKSIQARKNRVFLVGNLLQLSNLSPSTSQPLFRALASPELDVAFDFTHCTAEDRAQLSTQFSRMGDRALLRELYACVVNTEDAMLPALALKTLQRILSSTNRDHALSVLAFSTDLISVLWQRIVDFPVWDHKRCDLTALAMDADLHGQFTVTLAVWSAVYHHALMILDDDKFRDLFDVEVNTRMILLLKCVLFHGYWRHPNYIPYADGKSAAASIVIIDAPLCEAVTSLFLQLRGRHSRRAICPDETWIMKDIVERVLKDEVQRGTARAERLLGNIPMVLPFKVRVDLFDYFIRQDRESSPLNSGFLQHHPPSRISRDRLLQDGFSQLSSMSGQQLKGRVQIQFLDAHGMEEAGVDGGGLFKEFLLGLLKIAFNPEYGLFRETTLHTLFPNPKSSEFSEGKNQALAYYNFIGKMVGKALYDGIQLENNFAIFFLRKCLGQYCDVNDLVTLDPDVHKNLMFLKTYKGDISDLSLNFTVTDESLGQLTVTELMENGANTPVTNANVTKFLYLVGDYRMNKQIDAQSSAFIAGMRQVIKQEWLELFSADELQLLVGGSNQIDFKDLRANTQYGGGYSANHEMIRWFWEVVETFEAEDQAALLKFTTSCPRAPLQGFKALHPRFCVQRSSGNDQNKLPTASTCVNLLRLPRYNSKERLREKLLYGIRSNTGFELS